MTSSLSPSRVLLPMGLAICLSLFGDLTLFAVLSSQLHAVGLTLGSVGIMLGIHRLIRIPGNPLAGLLFDRRQRRPLFVAGMVLAVLSTAGYGLVQGFWPFLLTRLIWGAARALLNVGGLTMVLDISTAGNRGRCMGIYNLWVVAGLALGPMVGGFLVDAIGFQMGILTCAGLTAVGLAVALFALPETAPWTNARRPEPGQPRAQQQGTRRPITGQQIYTLLKSHTELLPLLALFLIVQFTGDGIVFSTVNLLLQERFGQMVDFGERTLGVASASGLILGLRSMTAGVAGSLAGVLSDTPIGRVSVIAGGLLLAVVGFGSLALATPLELIALGVVLGAAGSGAILATLPALVGDLTPKGREGIVMGAYAGAGDVGSTAGPFLAFALAPVLDLRWIYAFCSLVFLLGLGLLRPWNQPQRKTSRETS